MIYLKVSSASQEIPLGYFLSGTDGNTELTTLTIANTDIKLWKNGATALVNKASGGATHMSAGIYYTVLDDSDSDTLGSLNIYCHPTGALPCKTDCVVLSANIFDSFIGATSTLIVGSVTGAVGSVAGNVSGSVASITGNVVGSVGSVAGNVSGSVASVTGNVVGSVASVVGAVGSVAGNVSGSVASVTGNVAGSVASVTGSVGSVAGNVSGSVASVTGNVVGSVASVTGSVGSVAGNVSGSVNSIVTTVSAAVVSMGVGVLTSTAIADELFYTSEEVSQEVWDYSPRTLSGDQSFTLIGNLSGNVNGSVGSVTGNVVGSVGSVAGNVSGSVASVTGNVVGSVASVVGAVGSVAGNVSGSVASVTGNVAGSVASVTGNVSGSVASVTGNVAGSVASVTGNVSGSVGSVVGAVGSVAGNVSGSVGSVVNGATLTQINSLVSGIRGTDNDSLKNISDQLDGISVSGSTPQAIWEYSSRTLSGTQTFTLIGNLSGNVNGSVGSIASTVSSNVVGMANNVITDAAIASDAEYTLEQIGGSVWDIQRSAHTSTGSFGEYVNTSGASSSLTASDVWSYSSRTLSGNQTFTLIGNVSGNVNGSVGSVTGNIGGSVASVTGSVGSVAGNVSGSVASVTGNIVGSVASVVGAVGSVAGNVSGSVASITGNVVGSVGSVVGAVGSVAGNVSGSVASITGNVVGSVGSVAGNVSGSVASVTGNVAGSVASVTGNVSGSVGSVVNGATLTQINSLVSGIRGTDNDSLKNISDQLDSISVSGSSPQAIWEYASRTLTSTGIPGTVNANVVSMAAGVITSTAIADDAEFTVSELETAIWDAQRSNHLDSGTFGEYVNVQSSSGNISETFIANSVWNSLRSSYSSNGSFGEYVNTSGVSIDASTIWSYNSRTLSGNQTFNLIGNISGSVASVTAVSDKTGYSLTVTPPTSSTIATAVWANSTRLLSGDQTFNLIGNLSGSVASVTGNVVGSVASVTGSVGSVAGNVSGSVASVVGAVGSVSGLTGATVATSVWAASSRTLSGNQSFTLIGNISGNVNGSVGSVAGNVSGSVASITGNVAGSVASVTGNVSGSVGSVVNGATLTQINSLVSGIRGSDNDSLKNISDEIAGISVSGATASDIWAYSNRTLSGNQTFNLIGNISGSVGSVVGAVGSVAGNISGSVASVTGNVGGSVASVIGSVGSVTGNVSGSIASVINGATLAQINSLVSGIRGSDNDSLKNLSDEIGSISVSGATASEIWSYSSRSLSGVQTFNLIGNVSGSVASVTGNVAGSVASVTGAVGSVAGNVSGSVASIVNGATLTQINSLVSGIRGADNDSLKTISDELDGISVSGSSPSAIWAYATRTLTSSGSVTIDAADVWTYPSRTLTSTGTSDATLANQIIIINHLIAIKGAGWVDENLVAIMAAIENGTWGGFGV